MPLMPGRFRTAALILGYGLGLSLLILGLLLVLTRRTPGQPIQLKEPPTSVPVRVDVAGAVLAPGVYSLTAGSIVQDAIAAAGGATGLADLNGLNLARLLKDGDMVWVPALGPTATTPAGVPATAGSQTPARAGKLNLNTATIAELEGLPGIGPALAQRIVDFRGTHGPFGSIEAIQEVSGIGPAIFEKIKDLITV